VDKTTQKVICVAGAEGRKHDYRLFKESKTHIHPDIKAQVDTGYQGLQKRHPNTDIPKKKSKKNPLTDENKKNNRVISSSRVTVENVIRSLKIFRIMAEKYRCRRKRFTLRLNLIAGIYNFQL
jgi:IS5 family transposase